MSHSIVGLLLIQIVLIALNAVFALSLIHI